jgi:hypothetical protein
MMPLIGVRTGFMNREVHCSLLRFGLCDSFGYSQRVGTA